jgi:twitching motility protein PilT
MSFTLHQLLQLMIQQGASDLHITAGTQPKIRMHGSLVDVNVGNLVPEQTKELCYSILTDHQKQVFEETKELDLSFGIKGLSRFRGNVFVSRGAVAGAFRTIPYEIPSFEQLGLPPVIKTMAKRPRGLMLVTGPTGSGKSTTLASIIDTINRSRSSHIVTIEDPVEFVHEHKNCVVNQREVGQDTYSFKNALKSVLREDPDVVLIGEMRDVETIEAGLTLAETGHLCLATLHTNSTVQSITRIIDVFPEAQQAQVRTQLSFVLEGILAQQLIPRVDRPGRSLAVEVMVATPALRNMIREDKLHQVYGIMQAGQEKYGMQTMNQSLMVLLLEGRISLDDCLSRSGNYEEMVNLLQNEGMLEGHGRV